MFLARAEEHSLPKLMSSHRPLQQPSWLERANRHNVGQRQEPSHSLESDVNTFMRKEQTPHRASPWQRFPHNGHGAWIGISLFLCLSACAPGLYWAKPDAGEGEFEQDLRSCREILINDVQDSETSFNPFSRGITDDALAQCMNSKGWFLAEKP